LEYKVYYSIATELFVGYFALFLLTKILGKTQINNLSAFDFISALVLGELVGNAMYNDDTGIKEILFAVLIWGSLIYITEYSTQKSLRMRKFFEGSPSIVIKDGIISRKELARNHLDINQLQQLLRSKDIFSITDIDIALLEPDGSISVLKNCENESPTRADLNIKSKNKKLSLTIISDGEIIRENLIQINKTEEWLLNKLKLESIDTIKDVFYAEWTGEEDLHIQKLEK
jgi:uncharacterized membrane protein YcaP (DUF421 family)